MGTHLIVISASETHKWIEAQEQVSDEVFATVPDVEWLVYRSGWSTGLS